MRIRLTSDICGHDAEFRAYAHEAGTEIDVPDAQAVEWLERGLAEPVDPRTPVKRRETRVMRAGETR